MPRLKLKGIPLGDHSYWKFYKNNPTLPYFTYLHFRRDDEALLYVGKGTKQFGKANVYTRAFSSSNRNRFWKNATENRGFVAVIAGEYATEEEALKAETRLIRGFGRRHDKSGILVNLIEEASNTTNRGNAIRNKIKKIPVYKYSKEGLFLEEYESITLASKENSTLPSDISDAARQIRKHSCVGYQWRLFKTDKIPPLEYARKKTVKGTLKSKKVYQFSLTGDFIKEWEGSRQAAEAVGVALSAVRNCLCGISESAGGFRWSRTTEIKIPSVKTVKVYDLKDEFIGEYHSYSHAEKSLGLPYNSISVYVRQNKPHYKYKFIRS